MRVIQLYNYRAGTTRTGEYCVQGGTEDGYAPGPGSHDGKAPHSADTGVVDTPVATNWRINQDELMRVIQLYNYRSGTTRTGQYHVRAGTEDGYDPGPATRDGVEMPGTALTAAPVQNSRGARGATGTHSGSANYPASGGQATIACVFTYDGAPTSLGWAATIPDGWSYAGGTNEPGTKPNPNDTDTIEWTWSSIPASPINFTYTLNVPGGQTGDKQIGASAKVRYGGGPLSSPVLPNPLVISPPPAGPTIAAAAPGTATGAGTGSVTVPSQVTVAEGGNQTFSVVASGGTGTYQYSRQWSSEANPIAGANSATFSYAPGFDTVVHPAQFADRTLVCTVTDGGRAVATATWQAARVTDVDQAPTQPQIGITPLAPYAGQALTANLTTPSSDADNDALTYICEWRREGSQTVLGNAQSLPAGQTQSGEVWTVAVRPCTTPYGPGSTLVYGSPGTAQVTIGAAPGEWLFTIELTNADKPSVEFGMHPEAKDAPPDPLDLDSSPAPNPPNPVGGAYFFDATERLYRRDVRAVHDSATLDLEVVANSNPVTLSWNPQAVPAGKHLFLYELTDTGQEKPDTRVDMGTASGFTVQPQSIRDYAIECGTAASFQLTLSPGWNLISLPLVPLDPAATVVLATNVRASGADTQDAGDGSAVETLRDGKRGTVYSGSAWRWNPSKPDHQRYEVVTQLTALTGYWVYRDPADGQIELTVSGMPPEPATVGFLTGWNLVGPPGTLLAPYADARVWGHIWSWDGAAGLYEVVTPGEDLEPGRGYWIYATEPFTLNWGR